MGQHSLADDMASTAGGFRGVTNHLWIIWLFLVPSVICIVAFTVCFLISLFPVNCSDPYFLCLQFSSPAWYRGGMWRGFRGNTKLENITPNQYVSPQRKPIRFYHIIGTKNSRQFGESDRNKRFLWNNQKEWPGSSALVLTHHTSAVLSLCSCSCQLYP